MESWRYKQDEGMIEGPVSGEQLRALYESGKITLNTAVRSTAAGGEWKRFGDAKELWPQGALSRTPWAVKRLWPFFLFGIPILGGLIDVFISQSTGNAPVEAAAPWLMHFPVALMVAAAVIWLFLIIRDTRKTAPQASDTGLLLWFLALPFYMSWLWWVTPTVSSVINVAAGFDFPSCQSDIVQGEVKSLFPGAAAKAGHSALGAISLSDAVQQIATDRIKICTGKVAASDGQSYSMRYKIEDRGNSMFHNSLRGLNVTIVVD